MFLCSFVLPIGGIRHHKLKCLLMDPDLRDALLNEFALRCFRDVADGDYVAARMAYRAELLLQAYWASQQALEKYVKGILVFRRIPRKKPTHSLRALLHASAVT